MRAQPKKGGLRCGHSPKKGGLRCGHNQKRGGLRHVYNPKKGEFRTGLVKREGVRNWSCSKGGLGSLFIYYLYFYLSIWSTSGGVFWQAEKGVLGAGTAIKRGLWCGSGQKRGVFTAAHTYTLPPDFTMVRSGMEYICRPYIYIGQPQNDLWLYGEGGGG